MNKAELLALAEALENYTVPRVHSPACDKAAAYLRSCAEQEPVAQIPEGWKFNHAQEADTGIWDVGFLDPEDDRFSSIISVDTGNYYKPQHAEPIARAIFALLTAQPVAQEPLTWVSVDAEMPASGRIVLACYANYNKQLRRVRAKWVKAKTEEASSESDIGEYDEGSDCYYNPEGWYECIDNWDDYSAVAIIDPVTHWMPLPEPPHGIGGKP